jgi:hypothetical protein
MRPELQIKNRFEIPQFDQETSLPLTDYTVLSVDMWIRGFLADGRAIEATVRCPKCHRVGVASMARDISRRIVHRGRVTGDILYATDFCDVTLAAKPVAQ